MNQHLFEPKVLVVQIGADSYTILIQIDALTLA